MFLLKSLVHTRMLRTLGNSLVRINKDSELINQSLYLSVEDNEEK